MSLPAVRALVVVVPVRDEAELLGRCLGSLAAAVDAAAGVGVHSVVRIVLDACSDASADVAARHPFPVLRVEAARVGVARSMGVASGLAELLHVPSESVWIANTDADSSVPANWLTEQLSAAAAGADVFVGTVRPDFEDLSEAHRRHWLRTHVPGSPNGHVHGASLGVRASTYAAAGGFDPLPEHEDVALVERCRAIGAVLLASDAAEVATSGRAFGRTPGGYAAYLRDQARVLAEPST